MADIRGAFRVAHSAHFIGVLKSGFTEKRKDQVDIVYEHHPDIAAKIRQLYPIPPHEVFNKTYSCLEAVKNRSGQLGSILFLYEKAFHRMIPVNIDEETMQQQKSIGDGEQTPGVF